jgi:outer membrane protein insertion porin family
MSGESGGDMEERVVASLRRRRPRLSRLAACLVVAFAWLLPMEVRGEEQEETAEMRVRGYGFFGNRALMRTLNIIRDPDAPPAYFTANQIEDSALLLLAQMQQDGHLRPEVEARITLVEGPTITTVWDAGLLTELPRPLQASRVRFRVRPGLLYHYESIEFEGLQIMEEDEAKSFFVATGFLLETRQARVFTQAGLESGLSNLREMLVRQGYERVQVVVQSLERDDETGQVFVTIRVTEGPQSLIRSARATISIDGEREERTIEVPPGQPFSRIWMQDRAQDFRAEFYPRGYPDTEVETRVEERVRDDNRVLVDVLFEVETGPYVEVGRLVFRGHEKTLERVMRRRLDIRPGEPLNRVRIDRGRFRLARLGIFDWVDIGLEEVDEHTRDVIVTVEEGREVDVNLLFGYGSYEMLRVGLEVEQFNLFGRAHRSRLLLAQSLRSSSFNYRYMVPELFGEEIHGFGSVFGLRREEQDFDRREFGSTVGLQTLFYRIDLDASLRYSFQLLESRAGLTTGADGLDSALVGAVDLTLQRDLRDNPIYPERGHKMATNFEVASDWFGGEVDYQRAELAGSYHRHIGGGRYIHLALSHGLMNTFGEVEREIPINRRFFMGGERTVRGYLEGEASPRNEAGQLVGSETYVLLNLELEQALTERWSVVAFSDSIGFARRVEDYPVDEALYTIGLGVRYKTFIGPIRLEYGHNLNPRPLDPRGALHLSIGFPF